MSQLSDFFLWLLFKCPPLSDLIYLGLVCQIGQVVSTCAHFCPPVSTTVHLWPLVSIGFHWCPLVSTYIHLYPLVSSCLKLWTFWISVTEWTLEWSSFNFSHFFTFFTFLLFSHSSLSPLQSIIKESRRTLAVPKWSLGGILHNGCPKNTSRKLHINFHNSTWEVLNFLCVSIAS